MGDNGATPVPVLVVGGYLGAGKTTLVNHLLRASGQRLMVLVNDFGQSVIDAQLIEASDGDVLQLAGGCVCCQIGDELSAALARVADTAPERVVIETSGVAQPAAVATMVSLTTGLQLDAVVVVADGERIDELLADRYVGDIVAAQLAQADLVVLNRAEETSGGLAGLAAWTHAPVLPTIDGSVSASALVGPAVGGRVPADLGPADLRFNTLRLPGEGDPVAVLAAVQALPGLVRAKGFVHAADGTVHVLQVAGRRASVAPWVRPGSVPPPGVLCITRR